jgi:putative redox protein
MTSKVEYTGGLHTVATHLASGSIIETDAPTDNHGKGERFSPTDLVATALASCILTTIGLSAETHGLKIEGAVCYVEKIMKADPRRIGTIKIDLDFSKCGTFDDKQRTIIERIAHTCPVFYSLHPDCQNQLNFIWQ